MYAVINGADGRLQWGPVPDPQIKDDEVLLQVHAAALNRADLLQRAGQYPPPPGWPDWYGLEAAGVIVAVGKDVLAEGRWLVGDRACALLGGGGQAEYVAVPAGMLLPIPAGRSLVEAAAMPEAFATAYLNLFHEGRAKAGDTLLVTAGGSGLASVIIPMAKAYGLRVLTTVRSEAHVAQIAPLGADRIINTSQAPLADALREELEAGHPVDVAIDCLGGSQLGACLPYLAHGARWIMIAALAGNLTEIDLKTIYVRNIRIIGSTLRSRTTAFKTELLATLVREVWPMVEHGLIPSSISAVLPAQQAEEAQAILQRGGNVGKVVLQMIDA